MRDVLAQLRENYFNELAAIVGQQDVNLIVLTHLLDDRAELLNALNRVAPINAVIAIPYSVRQSTYDILKENYCILTPSLAELYDKAYLHRVLDKYAKNKPIILLEIGGYFAKVLPYLSSNLKDKLLGVIEDTELGHREYLHHHKNITCPIVSVARSILKETEDFLVGSSCLFSTEKILRDSGFPIEGKRSLVLGFGKIGRGIAHSLLRHHCPVLVYDTDPIKRINALSEGFQIPDKQKAFAEAEVIYGTTGTCSIKKEEITNIRQGAILVSCSSKDIEFDLAYLDTHYQKETLATDLSRYRNARHTLYLAGAGRPVNFIDGAVIGPVLALVQAEIMLAIPKILSLNGQRGMYETDLATKQLLAEKWLHYFCDGLTGRYKHD